MGDEVRQTDGESVRQPSDSPLAVILTQRNIVGEGETPEDALIRVLDENDRLRTLADDGRAYRHDLIEDAIHEGIRARGNDFSEETYRSILGKASLVEIKRFISDWRAIAAASLPAGRSTTEGQNGIATMTVQRPRVVPDDAYGA